MAGPNSPTHGVIGWPTSDGDPYACGGPYSKAELDKAWAHYGETGRLVTQDVDAIEAVLRDLCADTDLRARMGAAGREHAGSASWDENAERVLAIYREALALSQEAQPR